MREVELLVRRAQVREQVEHVVQRLVRLGRGLVHLVQHDDRLQPQRQRLGGHELRLRHRPFGGIDQQTDAIDHGQDAFDLAPEVGVAGGVDDVDPRALPFDRSRLGKDGDPAFAFDVVRIHRPLGDRLVLAEAARLLEQLIDQRRLAVVDVGDDGDVADVHGCAFMHCAVPLSQHRPDCQPKAPARPGGHALGAPRQAGSAAIQPSPAVVTVAGTYSALTQPV